MTDAELTIYGDPPPQPSSRAEPCETCGAQLVVLDVFAVLLGLVADGAPKPARPRWMELRTFTLPVGGGIQLRSHTPDRCRAVRGGQPEPWSDPDPDDWDDEDDDE